MIKIGQILEKERAASQLREPRRVEQNQSEPRVAIAEWERAISAYVVSLYPKFFRGKRKRICAKALEKAVAGYSVLYDVYVFFNPPLADCS